ncbi:hypothetical protein BC343_09065 [Mucilaginibacter pedocola]|uniref:Uncharacterized protein n=1 Tax=Mucilaginibacter pedocola TaxID=1792845 RepID=A0A1S9PDX7_9SPHI|nr:hypothetical protein BC343_09065 [Mucilaginibacter pedocola]
MRPAYLYRGLGSVLIAGRAFRLSPLSKRKVIIKCEAFRSCFRALATWFSNVFGDIPSNMQNHESTVAE